MIHVALSKGIFPSRMISFFALSKCIAWINQQRDCIVLFFVIQGIVVLPSGNTWPHPVVLYSKRAAAGVLG